MSLESEWIMMSVYNFNNSNEATIFALDMLMEKTKEAARKHISQNVYVAVFRVSEDLRCYSIDLDEVSMDIIEQLRQIIVSGLSCLTRLSPNIQDRVDCLKAISLQAKNIAFVKFNFLKDSIYSLCAHRLVTDVDESEELCLLQLVVTTQSHF